MLAGRQFIPTGLTRAQQRHDSRYLPLPLSTGNRRMSSLVYTILPSSLYKCAFSSYSTQQCCHSIHAFDCQSLFHGADRHQS